MTDVCVIYRPNTASSITTGIALRVEGQVHTVIRPKIHQNILDLLQQNPFTLLTSTPMAL